MLDKIPTGFTFACTMLAICWSVVVSTLLLGYAVSLVLGMTGYRVGGLLGFVLWFAFFWWTWNKIEKEKDADS